MEWQDAVFAVRGSTSWASGGNDPKGARSAASVWKSAGSSVRVNPRCTRGSSDRLPEASYQIAAMAGDGRRTHRWTRSWPRCTPTASLASCGKSVVRLPEWTARWSPTLR